MGTNSTNKNKSPYSAGITGCALLFYEYMRILPLLMDDDSEQLIKEEIVNNNLMHVNSLTARKRFMAEFKRRYNAVPISFWQKIEDSGEAGQRMGLLYAILKAYKLVFDFHFNVTVKRWNSIEQTLTRNDVMMEFNAISAKDSFVDGWTEKTKIRCVAHYMTILRQVGLLEESSNKLHPMRLEAKEYEYYFRTGEDWFLEACLLYPYEINEIKSELL